MWELWKKKSWEKDALPQFLANNEHCLKFYFLPWNHIFFVLGCFWLGFENVFIFSLHATGSLCFEKMSRRWSLHKRSRYRHRVLSRISKMPVQNSDSQISTHPNLATNLLYILIPTSSNSLLCQNSLVHFNFVLEDG